MDRFIASLPAPVVAFAAILLGFIFIVAYDPPKTACDTQIEYFREAQRDFLYGREQESGAVTPPLANKMYELCKTDGTPGGCFEYFQRLKRMVADLDNIPRQCSETAANEPQIQANLFKSMKLMIQIAWGDRGPASTMQRNGWYDSSDLSIFCDLNSAAQRLFDQEVYGEWKNKVLAGLPEANKTPKDQLAGKTLFSFPCRSL